MNRPPGYVAMPDGAVCSGLGAEGCDGAWQAADGSRLCCGKGAWFPLGAAPWFVTVTLLNLTGPYGRAAK